MPLFRQWNTEGGGVWGIWKVTESFTELRDQLSAVLPYDEELQAMKSASRCMEYVAVRVLLKTLLGKEYSILHYPSGKPFLENETLRISISHTKGYVAVGVHARQEVGIDIEQRTEKVCKVRSRFVREDEMQGEALVSEEERLSLLLLHWSAKETLYKLINSSEVDFLDHLRIRDFSLLSSGHFMAEEYRTVNRNQFSVSYWVHPDFVCTWSVFSGENE